MLLDRLTIRDVELPNRVVMAPMSQRAADPTGRATPWHLVHYGARAVGGVGLIMIEDCAVAPEGRGHSGALGLWDDDQGDALRPVVEFCHDQGATVGLQLGHTGRKAFADEADPLDPVVGATGEPFDAASHEPRALSDEEVRRLVGAYGQAAARARRIGVDVVEVHASNGYLLHEFLSPLTNTRPGPYGPDGAERVLVEVVAAVRDAVGPGAPVFVRLCVDDLAAGGWRPETVTPVVESLRRAGCDVVDAAAGGAVDGASSFDRPVDFTGLAREIRTRTGVPTVVAGGIADAAAADEALASGACDLVAVGRLLLENPYWAASLVRPGAGT
ncbi:hypothetical protein [Actinomycetospora sp. TBRC 11914]|uniref:oxidoreductase n=1 Tax=Actinomycetospora sp. TBRC 11914 TaxID=2729387 RepID=UPI00145E67F6|nr:hypothetical protein [Actinomycetospora sp. TBRC 11914]NMO94026.1 hypothetical protein [Actinomycetospora sp. TBRC 11914]